MDKFETAARIMLAVSFLVVAPLLVGLTGRLVRAGAMEQVRQEQAWREVGAVLLRSAPQQLLGFGSMTSYWLPARWVAPDGAVRTGPVPVRPGSRAGDSVPIWVNPAGRMTGRAPLSTGLVTVRTALAEFGTAIGLALVALALAGLLRVLMDRRRMAYWAMEWACFGPRWTTRRWPRS